jgi:hypothetical protein
MRAEVVLLKDGVVVGLIHEEEFHAYPLETMSNSYKIVLGGFLNIVTF